MSTVGRLTSKVDDIGGVGGACLGDAGLRDEPAERLELVVAIELELAVVVVAAAVGSVVVGR